MTSALQSGNVIPFPAQLRSQTLRLASGDAGVKQTINWMRHLALSSEGANNPAIRQLALQIVRGQAARDDYGQAVALFEWVKANIEFRGEYDETLQTPLLTAQWRAGDCDDHATLMYALLRTIGIQSEFVTIATDPTDPDRQFSHVYTCAWIRNKQAWLPLDTTVARSYPGWQPERITRIKAWGLGALDPDYVVAQAGGQTVKELQDRGFSDQEITNLIVRNSSKTEQASKIIRELSSAAQTLIPVVRSNGAAAFDVRRTDSGFAGNLGVGGISTTTIALGIAGLALAAFTMSRGRN
jgi:transglutaminase-like putative cysteine protease